VSLTPGVRLGSYEIVALLGSGGMGEVYRARDPRLEREVAIKTVRSTLATEGARARLWREARAAASVNHPGVCQIYDVGEIGGDIFLVMELLSGEALDHRLADGPVPLDEAVQITLGILAALDALHRREIVHRDLKPSNVFLTDGHVKLLDFGLARALGRLGGSDMAITQAGVVVGTPRYMAPELWAGDHPDPRTDLFATGLLLFEMLTAKPAFPGTDLMQIYHAIMSGQPPALSGSPAVIAVDGVVHRALEKRPEDRYHTADAMASALRAAVTLADSGTRAPVRAATRLIVLPFRMVRPDADLDFLSFSLPDAVTASLAGLESLVVRSTLAGMKYPPDAVDLKVVASELGVDVVLCGTLLRAGEQLRATAQLVEAPSGAVVWSQTLQVPLRDIFELQDHLVRGIVDSLSVPLSAREAGRLRRDLPASARAYEFYLRANQLSYDPAQMHIARELYRSTIEEDPNYAPAWARLGRVCRVLAKYGADDAEENLRRADEAFQRALHIDPDLSLAHNLYTYFEVESLGHARDAMVRLITRARSHAGDPDLYAGLVLACRYCGLLDASLAADRHARRLDPAIRTSVMYTHFMLGDWERAMASDIEEMRWVTNYVLPFVGRSTDAVDAYRRLEERPLPPMMRLMVRAGRCAIEGDRDSLLATLPSFAQVHAFDPEAFYFVARELLHLREIDAGLDMLERCIERGFYCAQVLLRDPWLDSARTHPRFTELVTRADARHREAEAEFRRVGGGHLLGLSG
jgi:serine/threonine protein kinase/tetratricopeptide (TPR) repeat protein